MNTDAQRQKNRVALLSVISNSLLVVLKLVVGVIIGSVSVISEAIHSGMDLVAVVIALGDDPNEYLIVYGVNHAATGKATYSNFGMYGAKAVNGVGAVSNHDFAGTAEKYIPGHHAAKYLYVWKVARRALGDPQCLEVKWGIGAAGIDLDQPSFVGFRAYVEPSTKVGPFWSEVLYDKVIKFSGSK